MYETGGLRRTHLRRRTNILKRLLFHAVGFNFGAAVAGTLRNRKTEDLAGHLGRNSPSTDRHCRILGVLDEISRSQRSCIRLLAFFRRLLDTRSFSGFYHGLGSVRFYLLVRWPSASRPWRVRFLLRALIPADASDINYKGLPITDCTIVHLVSSPRQPFVVSSAALPFV